MCEKNVEATNALLFFEMNIIKYLKSNRNTSYAK